MSARDTELPVELLVLPDPEAAAAAVAALLAGAAQAREHIALAGGSTPRRAYELAAAQQPDWGGAHVWLSDERCVPPEDERSNLRLVRESLLAALEVQPTVHPVAVELGPEQAAAAYSAELTGAELGLALLGLGPDGHTASLFPGSPALDEHERLAVATAPGLAPWVERVTLTLSALAAARHVVFLAVGDEKAEAAYHAFSCPPSAATPASLVRSARGRSTAVLDRAAAAGLPKR